MPEKRKHKGIREHLGQVLQAGENERCEFRRSFGEETFRTLCAFANTHGGEVWLGVDDDGSIVGVSLGRESARDWANQISQGLGLNLVAKGFLRSEGKGRNVRYVLSKVGDKLAISWRLWPLKFVEQGEQP